MYPRLYQLLGILGIWSPLLATTQIGGKLGKKSRSPCDARAYKRRARDSNPQPHYWGTTFPVWPLAIRLPSIERHKSFLPLDFGRRRIRLEVSGVGR